MDRALSAGISIASMSAPMTADVPFTRFMIIFYPFRFLPELPVFLEYPDNLFRVIRLYSVNSGFDHAPHAFLIIPFAEHIQKNLQAAGMDFIDQWFRESVPGHGDHIECKTCHDPIE